MKVYIIYEKKQGCETSVAKVFSSLQDAKDYLAGPEGSDCYLASEFGQELKLLDE